MRIREYSGEIKWDTFQDHPQIWGKPFRNADWDRYFEHEKMEPAGIINSAIPKIEGEPLFMRKAGPVCMSKNKQHHH